LAWGCAAAPGRTRPLEWTIDLRIAQSSVIKKASVITFCGLTSRDELWQALREGAERFLEVRRLVDVKNRLENRLVSAKASWTRQFEVREM